MPIVTPQVSRHWARAGWRPQCWKCGRFIGAGGFYDVIYDYYNGGWEEGYSTCKEHTDEPGGEDHE